MQIEGLKKKEIIPYFRQEIETDITTVITGLKNLNIKVSDYLNKIQSLSLDNDTMEESIDRLEVIKEDIEENIDSLENCLSDINFELREVEAFNPAKKQLIDDLEHLYDNTEVTIEEVKYSLEGFINDFNIVINNIEEKTNKTI